MISELASRAFNARNIAHREHWKTDSYAAHVALGSFYEDVIDAIDAVIENYQGLYGKIEVPATPQEEVADIRQYLQDEADWMEVNLTELSGGSESISNLIQTLISVYTKTVFLLGLR